MRLHKLFTSIAIVLLLSGIFVGLAQFPLVVKAEGENWLSGWGYRRSLIVGSGIHVITVHYGSGNDVLGHTYLDGLCQSDFDDIRFTSSDGETLVADVTVRTKINGNYVEFKVNVITSPIYVYYGEGSASGVYANEVFGSGSLGDTAVLTQHYNITADPNVKTITGIARVSPVTGFVTSLEAEISSYFGSTAQMALVLVKDCIEEIDGADQIFGRRIIARTETKSIPVSGKHREVFVFDKPVPIFKGTTYGITLWGGLNTTIWYDNAATASSFRFTGDLSGDMILQTSALDSFSYGRFMNYVQVDDDEQNVLFKDTVDYTQSRSLWHHHWANNGRINANAGQGIGGSYAFNSTITAPSGEGWGELSVIGEIADGNKRFWSGIVRLSASPNLGSHVELVAWYSTGVGAGWVAINGFGVNRTETGVQWLLSVKSQTDVWSHTLFGNVEIGTDYLVILSYETDGVNGKSEVWVTKLSQPNLLEEASPTASMTVPKTYFGDLLFIGAADYPLGNVSPLSAFFDEITLIESFPAVFGAWGIEEVFVEPPTFTSEGVVSGASYSHDPISPGSISSIFGEYLALDISSAEMVPLPTTLGGTTVYLDDIECPLYYVSPGQINFQVPYELEGVSVALMVIECDGISSVPVSIAIASVNPGIFTINMQGTGAGCILHNFDSSLVTSINPATRGEYLQVYCTGLGLVNPAVETGEAASSDPLCYTLATPVLMIGGEEAEVVYSGLAPGFVGLYQVNVQVPDTAPVGEEVSLVMSVAGVESNLVTLAIQ